MRILDSCITYDNTLRYASETELQEHVDDFIKRQVFIRRDSATSHRIPHITVREFRIPEIGRISDHVLVIGDNKVVNFECKLQDVGHALVQAKSHLAWADYSVVVIPANAPYITNKLKIEFIQLGIGLFYWFRGIGLFEFIYPKYNKKSNKELKKSIITKIKSVHNTLT